MVKRLKQIKLHKNEETINSEWNPLESETDDASIQKSVLNQSIINRIPAGSSPEKPKNNLCYPNDKTDETERLVQHNIQTYQPNQLNCCNSEESTNCGICGPNVSYPFGGKPVTEEKPCESETIECNPRVSDSPEKNLYESEATEKTPREIRNHERNPCETEPPERNPCETEPPEKNPCTKEPPEKNVQATQTKQRCPTIDSGNQIVLENRQLQYSDKISGKMKPNMNERQRNRNHRQRTTTVPSSSGYQPDFYDDSTDMQNWQEHSNRQSQSQNKKHTRDGEQKQRSRQVPDLDFEAYVDEEESFNGNPANQQEEHVLMNEEMRQLQQELINVERHRLKLIQRMEVAQQATLAQLEKQQPQPEDLQAKRQRRIENEKQKLAVIRQRVEARQREQQITERQSFDSQVISLPSSQYCNRNAETHRDPLPASNQLAAADQQNRQNICNVPECTMITEENCHERTPETRQVTAQVSCCKKPKRSIPNKPLFQSDSNSNDCKYDSQISQFTTARQDRISIPSAVVLSSDYDCNDLNDTPTEKSRTKDRNTTDYPNMNVTTTQDRRKRTASTEPQNTDYSDYTQLQNCSNGDRTRPRTLDAATSTHNSNPRLMPKKLNFSCSCNIYGYD